MRYLGLLFALGFVAMPLAAAEERPLSALFLGDRGHHRPADRAAQLAPVMADRGIVVTYTEDVGELNPTTLAKYDALVVYANIDNIAPGQEKALLDYVAQGGGFVPLHCASFCFRNSQAYVDLVGAQFQRHGTGEFDTKFVDDDHPITRGLDPFHTWDETYVHTKHNTKDRHVLQVRPEGNSEEPWTWVRTHGKGRVFYTAYGHDARTWSDPGFHDLVERGIRWAAAKGEVSDHRPGVPAGLKPFAYDKAKIPLYLPGKKWGTQGEPIDRMQRPVSTEESMQHMVVPKGFEVRLFAAEPEIEGKPITMAWDHKGRLWVVESVDYPNNKQPLGQGHDRIRILEDTDHDGKADRFTVFADKLSIPTSLAFARGGVVVHQAPETLFLKDTNGDDQADVREVLFRGWDTRDTHAGPSNLRWGLDNWLWSIDGYSGFRGTIGGEVVAFRQGLFRFKPDGSQIEFLRNTTNNSWGVGFSEEGLVFGSTANGCPSVYLAIPNRYYEKVRGWTSSVLDNIAVWNRMYPITDKVRQVDHHGGFTAGAGHALYTARAYPQHYWNRAAFVCEPTGHVAATFLFERHGSDFVSYNAWNLLASDDEWTSPVFADVGPDGNVWIIDWYNFIVQHNPTPEGFKTGKGNAYETPLRDKSHGRIYRLVAKDAKPSAPLALDPLDGPGLVAALKNDNMFWRMHAQRLLVERAKTDVVPELIALVRDESVDAIGLNPGAIHALWTLHGLGALEDPQGAAAAAVAGALKHPSAGVRRNAVQVLPHALESVEVILAVGLLRDREPLVRLAALLALADRPPSGSAAQALVDAMAGGRLENDRWLGDAAIAAAATNDHAVLAGLAARRFERPPTALTTRVAARVAEHYARGAPAESVGVLLAALAEGDERVVNPIVAGLAKGWPKDRPAKLDGPAERALSRLLVKVASDLKGQVILLAERWGSKGLEKYAADVTEALLTTVRDEAKPQRERIEAARQLVDFRKDDAPVAQGLLELISPRTSPELAAGLIDAVGRSASAELGTALVERLASLTPALHPDIVRVLLARADWSDAVLKGIESGKLPLAELSLDQKQALAAHPDRAIARRARTLLQRGGNLPDPDRQKVIDALAATVLRPGDATRGKAVFTQQCAKCHSHSGEGGKVGPDLTGMAVHPKSELLVHVLDPSRSVEGNFIQYSVMTKEGRVLNGLLASESKTSVELIDTEGKKTDVLREDIDELLATRKSLMPEGFEKQVSADDLKDLLEFLTQRGKYLPLDLAKVATVVSTQGMFYSKASDLERLVFPDWSPKTFEGVPFQLVDPRGTRVPNAVLLNGPIGEIPPKMPKSVSLPCNAPAKAIHFLSGVSGWGYNGGDVTPSVSMIVRLHYAGGATEDHPLENGVHFADYIRRVDVPGSKLAFLLRNQQIRYLALHPKKPDVIESVELIKGPDQTAPVVMAVTVEVGGS
jgi:putative membrane-bound dehydrogenase-like protein